jgi:hypothetical protein
MSTPKKTAAKAKQAPKTLREGAYLVPQPHGGALARGQGGRKPGVPNHTTSNFRETVTQLLHANRDTIARWVTECAEGRPAILDSKGNVLQPAVPANPLGGLKAIAALAEFAAPRLSRQETVGDGGGPLTVVVRKEA